MSQSATIREATPAASRLTGRLSLFGSRRVWTTRFTWLLAMLWATLTLLLATLLMDAAWHLPALLRVLLGCAMIGLLLASLAGMAAIRRKASDDALLHDAVRLEAHHDLRDNPVVNGLQLVQQPAGDEGDASLTILLRQRAVERASAMAQIVDIDPADEKQTLRRHGRILLILLLLAGILLAAQPRLFSAGLVRLMDPWGDHPPFSLTRFEIESPVEAIVRHQDVIVRIRLAGQPPAMLEWVELDALGREKARWPVERVGSNQYERRLRRVREDIRFRLVGDTGYTRAMVLKVVDAAPEVLVEEPQTDEPRPQETASSQPATQPEQLDLSQHPQMQNLAQHHRDLVAAAQAVQAAADQLKNASPPTDQQLQQLTEAVDRFNRQLSEARAEAQAVQQQMQSERAENKSDDEPMSKKLEQAAAGFEQLLSELQIPRQPVPPVSSSDAAVPGWCESMSQAAAHDLSKLTQPSQGSSASAIGAGQGQGESGEAIRTNDDPPPTLDSSGPRIGVVRETLQAGQGKVDEHDARSQQVPPAYRTMVQQYFDRINQEQGRQ